MWWCFLLKKRQRCKAHDGYHIWLSWNSLDSFCSNLLELSKAMPISKEEDVCSVVRGDLSSEVAGAQLHLIIGSQFTPPDWLNPAATCWNIHQFAKIVFVCSVEKLCSVIFIVYLLWRNWLEFFKQAQDYLLSVYELQHQLEGVRVDISDVHLARSGLLHVLVQHAVKDDRAGRKFFHYIASVFICRSYLTAKMTLWQWNVVSPHLRTMSKCWGLASRGWKSSSLVCFIDLRAKSTSGSCQISLLWLIFGHRRNSCWPPWWNIFWFMFIEDCHLIIESATKFWTQLLTCPPFPLCILKSKLPPFSFGLLPL